MTTYQVLAAIGHFADSTTRPLRPASSSRRMSAMPAASASWPSQTAEGPALRERYAPADRGG
jgi:hypothetical protein